MVPKWLLLLVALLDIKLVFHAEICVMMRLFGGKEEGESFLLHVEEKSYYVGK